MGLRLTAENVARLHHAEHAQAGEVPFTNAAQRCQERLADLMPDIGGRIEPDDGGQPFAREQAKVFLGVDGEHGGRPVGAVTVRAEKTAEFR